MTSPEPQLKNLKVLVNDVEYVNADFAEITVSDGPGGVRVQALPTVTFSKSSGSSNAIIEALTAAVQARAGAKAAASEAAQAPES